MLQPVSGSAPFATPSDVRQRAGNAAARAKDKSEFSPAAKGIPDAFAAASLARKDPQALLGPPPVVPVARAAQADANRVTHAAKAGPVQAAQTLADLCTRTHDPAYQRAVLDGSRDTLTDLARRAGPDGDLNQPDLEATVDSLSRAANAGSPDTARALAAAFAQGLPDENLGDDDDELGEVLRHSVSAGNGALFGAQLADELRKAGKGNAADEAAKFTREGVDDARENFEETKTRYDELDGQLQGLTSDLGAAGSSPQDIGKVIAGFKQDHQSDFDAYNAAAGKLAQTLRGASAALDNPNVSGKPYTLAGRFGAIATEGEKLRNAATAALKDLPAVGATPAGNALLGDALEAQGRGERTFLDHVPALAAALPEDERNAYLDGVTAVTLQAAGTRAADFRQAGAPDSAENLWAGVEKNAGLFRADANALARVVTNLKNFNSVPDGAAFKTQYTHLANSVSGLPPRFALAVQSVGVALGTVSFFSQAQGFSQQDLNHQLQTVLTGVGTGVQAANVAGTAAGILTRASGFSQLASKAIPGLTSVVAGLSAISDFSKGDVVGGVTDSALAVGAGLLLAPPPFDVAGGILVAGASIFKLARGFFGGEGDGVQETDTKNALVRLGVSEDKAQHLKDLEDGRHYVGQFIGEQARRNDISPAAYLQWLISLPNNALDRVVHVARDVQTDDHGKLQDMTDRDRDTGGYDVNSGTGYPTSRAFLTPDSLSSAFVYLREHGLSPH